MSLSLYLLDCSEGLQTKLQALGFDTHVGSVGYSTRNQNLPFPLYEHDVVVYSPPRLPDLVSK